MSPITKLMSSDLQLPAPAGLDPLLVALDTRFGKAVRAVVLYGSTRRADNPRDGLVDLMVVVANYRAAHGVGLAALVNWLLPPNVYYLEAGPSTERVRCKYIVIAESQLNRRMRGGLDAYFWARFSQPCRLVFARDARARETLAAARATAARHFAAEAATLGPARLSAADFWGRALRASYGCELRPEPPGAAAALVERDAEFWTSLTQRLAPEVASMSLRDGEVLVRPSRQTRWLGRWRWRLRRIWSRTLNILRLFKAAGTFANGVEYLSWKLERHSGIRVEPTERMRRHPRLAAWGLLLRLIRSGALR